MEQAATKTMRRKAMRAGLASLLAVSVVLLPNLGAEVPQAEAASLASQANAVVKAAGAKSGTVTTRLKKAFNYIKSNYNYAGDYFVSTTGAWWKSRAKTAMASKSGGCYSLSAVFGVVAKKATGCKVRVAAGKVKKSAFGTGASGTQNHAWTEVKLGGAWYVYDVTVCKAAETSKFMKLKKGSKAFKNYYSGASYSTVKL